MSYAVFPDTLPLISLDGLEEKIQDVCVRTAMESGPAKVRRRFTAASVFISGQLVLSTSQLSVFDSFFRDSVAMGSLPFYWKHPRSLEPCLCRFSSPPVYSCSAGVWFVRLEIEILPVRIA